MKKYILCIFLSVCCSASLFAQFPINEETGKICYSEVIETDYLSKDQLYRNALLWMNKTFGNYKNVVQFDDKEAGKIVMKGRSTFYIENSPVIKKRFMDDGYSYIYIYIVTIDCRDNKYRYLLTDITSNSTLDYDEEYSLEKRIKMRERLQGVINEELHKDVSGLNKKELQKWENDIILKKELAKLDDIIAQREQEEFSSLISSLKSGMIVKDDF